MIGTQIECEDKISIGAMVFFVIGVIVALCSPLSGTPHPAIFSIMPFAIAMALWMTRRKRFSAELTENELICERPRVRIQYAELQGMCFPGKATQKRADIYLFDTEDVVRIPADVDVSFRELAKFFLSLLPPNGLPNVTPSLQKHRDEMVARFGLDKVFAYNGRSCALPRVHYRGAAVCLAITCAGIAWTIFGAAGGKGYEGWVSGLFFAIMAGLFGFVIWLTSLPDARVKGRRKAGLVVSPLGIALLQGDLNGEMSWEELQNVQYLQRPKWYQMRHNEARLDGIRMSVAGAKFFIADIYDRPMAMIHERIMSYWKGQSPVE